MSRLSEELLRVKSDAPLPPEVEEMVLAMIADLERAGVAEGLPRPGEIAPPLRFLAADGTDLALDEAIEGGPVALVFYRGPWCPFCNVHLRALERELIEAGLADARVLAASPFPPDGSTTEEELASWGLEVVTDPEMHAASALGLTFVLPDDVTEAYRRLGHDPEELTGTSPPRMTIPATLVIGRRRRVTFARADVNYRSRVEPRVVIAELRRATGEVGR
ncbi:MAG: AhpC/TSA family protein [Actinobacteria bacterium]|nr:AhpC/TSA family protein [Actinomycetota bacterium]